MENYPDITTEISSMEIITDFTLLANQSYINHMEPTINDKVHWTDNTEEDFARMIVITMFPIIAILGTIGNVLSFIEMRQGYLLHSSTGFYMSILALADTLTGKCFRLLA